MECKIVGLVKQCQVGMDEICVRALCQADRVGSATKP